MKFIYDFKEDLNSINIDIQNKFRNEKISIQNSYNIILAMFHKDKNIEEEIKLFSDRLESILPFIRPIAILSKKVEKAQTNNKTKIAEKEEKQKKNYKGISQKSRMPSNEYIELVYYKNDSEIIKKIKQLYRYYNNIGDIFTIINEMLGQPETSINYDENEVKYPYGPTLNILVIGKSGGGKSTLINLLLNEKKVLTGIKLCGLSNTKLFSRYIHKEYPIAFIDTPGIEKEEDFKKMKNYLFETKKLFGDGKYKIHAILYIINSSVSRFFNDEEISLINFIIRIMEIQIFFVCTRSENQKNALNFKELIKVNLIQAFGENTPLVDFIYPCQLLDEKDGIVKIFGIDELLNGINKFYMEEKNNLENIKKYILNNKNLNQHLDNKIFLSSLKQHNYKFNEYLNTFCDDLIKYYANLIYKKEKKRNYHLKTSSSNLEDYMNDFNNQNNMIIKITKMLIKHLAYELNGDLSNKEIINIFDSLSIQINEISPFRSSMNTLIENFGNSAKNIFLENLKLNSQSQIQYDGSKTIISKERNQFNDQSSLFQAKNDGMKTEAEDNYFHYLIDSYLFAIDSLEKLYKKQ